MVRLRLLANQSQEQACQEAKLLKHHVEHSYSQKNTIEKLRLDIIDLGEARNQAQLDNARILELIDQEKRAIDRLEKDKAELLKQCSLGTGELKVVRNSARISEKKKAHVDYRFELQRKENNSMLSNLLQHE